MHSTGILYFPEETIVNSLINSYMDVYSYHSSFAILQQNAQLEYYTANDRPT